MLGTDWQKERVFIYKGKGEREGIILTAESWVW